MQALNTYTHPETLIQCLTTHQCLYQIADTFLPLSQMADPFLLAGNSNQCVDGRARTCLGGGIDTSSNSTVSHFCAILSPITCFSPSLSSEPSLIACI